MNSAVRDKIILIVFPAVVVALVWWGWMRPTSKSASLQRELQAAKTALPEAALVAADRSTEKKLTATARALKDKYQGQLKHWSKLRGAIDRLSGHPERLHQISTVFGQRQLKILHQTELDSNSQDVQEKWLQEWNRHLNQPLDTILPDLKNATDLKEITESSGLQKNGSDAGRAGVAVWEIEFAGSYENAREAVTSLTEELHVIPLQLTMSQAPANLNLHRWTLVVLL